MGSGESTYNMWATEVHEWLAGTLGELGSDAIGTVFQKQAHQAAASGAAVQPENQRGGGEGHGRAASGACLEEIVKHPALVRAHRQVSSLLLGAGGSSCKAGTRMVRKGALGRLTQCGTQAVHCWLTTAAGTHTVLRWLAARRCGSNTGAHVSAGVDVPNGAQHVGALTHQ